MVSARIPVSAMSADRSTGALLRKEKSHGHHQIDILRSLKGEDSYGVAVSASHGLFGGFLLHREALLRFSPQASHRARPALGRLDKGSLER